MFKSILFIAVCISVVKSAKIIGIFMTPSYSHQVVFQPIWKELSLQGHDVTIITPNPLNDPTLTNLTEIDISEISYGAWKDTSLPTLGMSAHSTTEELKEISKIYLKLSHVLLAHPIFQELIRNESGMKYDLFLVEYLWPVMYPFKDIFNCPMVGIVSLPLVSTSYGTLGMPHHPVLDPDYVLPYATDLTFKERVVSTAFNVLFRVGNIVQLTPKMTAIAKKYFGENSRHYKEIAGEVSLVLVNSNMVTQNVKLTVPQFVEISGIHIKPPKPLPNDLQATLDNATEGVIYFSLGTNVKSCLLPKEKVKLFMDAFAELPYKILWKFEADDIPDIPPNVEIRKWLPQQDLLAHPNIKLFITQGGLQSMDEAVYHQVPVLTVPFFGDQRFNSDKMMKNGGGLAVNFHSFTSEELRDKALALITDKKYKERMTKLAAIAFDQPMSAVDKATWHINYVLRHDGASHLRYKALDLPFYQYYMLDVYAFFAILISLVSMVLLKIFRRIVIGYKVCKRFGEEMGIFASPEKSKLS